MCAARSKEYGEVDGITGYQTKSHIGNFGDDKDAKKLVADVTRILRMSHTFFWAVKPIWSDGLSDVMFKDEMSNLPKNFDETRFGPMLLSPQGLEMLVKYGQLTRTEVDALRATNLSPSQYPYVLIEWAGLRAMDGMRKGELIGGPGLEDNLLRQFTKLRAEYFNIGDFESGRMSMAYIIAVEIVVDVLVFTAPLAMYSKMGAFSIFASGLITLSFKGLLELSKAFLDTFGTDGYRSHNIRVDVLMSELNFGAANRWVNAGDSFPSETRNDTNLKQPSLDEQSKLLELEIQILDELNNKSKEELDKELIFEEATIDEVKQKETEAKSLVKAKLMEDKPEETSQFIPEEGSTNGLQSAKSTDIQSNREAPSEISFHHNETLNSPKNKPFNKKKDGHAAYNFQRNLLETRFFLDKKSKMSKVPVEESTPSAAAATSSMVDAPVAEVGIVDSNESCNDMHELTKISEEKVTREILKAQFLKINQA